jgi:hypothetical protein
MEVKMKSNNKKSTAERILELGTFLKTPRLAEEVRKEIKDKTGFGFDLQDIRVNLLYLLRRGQLRRKKEGSSLYRYYI